MVEARVGQRVQVDISGLQAPGVTVGGGVSATGTIIEIQPITQSIRVGLDVSFGGQSEITVPASRVTAIE